MKSLLTILASLLFSFSYADQVESDGTGAWGDDATWTGVVPVCGDTIIIEAGHTLQVNNTHDYAACGAPMFIEIYGTLDFTTNGRRLHLPPGSGVQIHSGGSLTGTAGGGGSSVFMTIGGVTVWQKSHGTITGPSDFGSPLPVDLLSFEASFDEGEVKLFWSTASEQNNEQFVIERSKDGYLWEEIIKVEGAGNSSSVVEYFEVDKEPLSGVSYYRLSQDDFNGERTTYHVVPVQNIKKGEVALDVFPNPTTPDNINVSLQGLQDQEVLLILRELSAKQHYSVVKIMAAHNAMMALTKALRLESGVYLVTASSSNLLYSQKVVIK